VCVRVGAKVMNFELDFARFIEDYTAEVMLLLHSWLWFASLDCVHAKPRP